MPATVLDFPSKERFIKEIKKGYDYIGISFILPNFIKKSNSNGDEIRRIVNEIFFFISLKSLPVT